MDGGCVFKRIEGLVERLRFRSWDELLVMIQTWDLSFIDFLVFWQPVMFCADGNFRYM